MKPTNWLLSKIRSAISPIAVFWDTQYLIRVDGQDLMAGTEIRICFTGMTDN